MRNAEIALHFDELGDLYELDGAIVHRVLAYRNAAKAIRESAASVEELARAGQGHRARRGSARRSRRRSARCSTTGDDPVRGQAEGEVPARAGRGHAHPGPRARRGAQAVRRAGHRLARRAAQGRRGASRSASCAGFGAKAEENILAALAAGADGRPKPRAPAVEGAGGRRGAGRRAARAPGARARGARRAARAAGPRPCKDLDLVATATDPAALAEAFCDAAADRRGAAGSGEAGARAVTHNGIAGRPADRRRRRTSATCSSTSPARSSTTRRCAPRRCKRGLHVSRVRRPRRRRPAPRTPARPRRRSTSCSAWTAIPPELRENRGELEAARAHELPRLIEVDDIRGELHCHTVASDGRQTIERDGRGRARARLRVPRRSPTTRPSHGFGNDVSPDELRAQIERVREVDERIEGITRADRHRGQRPAPTARSTTTTTCCASSTGSSASLHTSFRMREEEHDRAHDRRDGAPAAST